MFCCDGGCGWVGRAEGGVSAAALHDAGAMFWDAFRYCEVPTGGGAHTHGTARHPPPKKRKHLTDGVVSDNIQMRLGWAPH